MIPNKETNFIYFSSLLKENSRYSVACKSIISALEKHDVYYGFLDGTKDIWVRDFMPLQIEKDRFVSFKYDPSYLRTKPRLRSVPKEVCQTNGIEAEFSDVLLDGGNVVNWERDVVMTNRVFRENIRNQRAVKNELKSKLQAKIQFVDDLLEDMTGHIDGHLRFIDEKTLLVNELKNEDPIWVKSFREMAKKANFQYVEMPWFGATEKDSAVGVYVNYLEVGDLILFPVFEVPGNRDGEAIEVIRKVFPNRNIEPININEIAKEGGLLNCISWQIKR